MDITIKQLNEDLIEDYLFFFDNMVFTENPDWEKCYCYSFHFTGTSELWIKEDNRKAVIQLIRQDKMRGYLAYSKNMPVAWCNVNNRDNFQALKNMYTIEKSEETIASIVCFLVSPDDRGKGIATLLLARIIADYRSKGYNYLEAYPAKGSRSCELNYKGPLRLYESHGFKTVSKHDKYLIVRKKV